MQMKKHSRWQYLARNTTKKRKSKTKTLYYMPLHTMWSRQFISVWHRKRKRNSKKCREKKNYVEERMRRIKIIIIIIMKFLWIWRKSLLQLGCGGYACRVQPMLLPLLTPKIEMDEFFTYFFSPLYLFGLLFMSLLFVVTISAHWKFPLNGWI